MSVSHARAVPSLLDGLEGLTDPRRPRGCWKRENSRDPEQKVIFVPARAR